MLQTSIVCDATVAYVVFVVAATAAANDRDDDDGATIFSTRLHSLRFLCLIFVDLSYRIFGSEQWAQTIKHGPRYKSQHR